MKRFYIEEEQIEEIDSIIDGLSETNAEAADKLNGLIGFIIGNQEVE